MLSLRITQTTFPCHLIRVGIHICLFDHKKCKSQLAARITPRNLESLFSRVLRWDARILLTRRNNTTNFAMRPSEGIRTVGIPVDCCPAYINPESAPIASARFNRRVQRINQIKLVYPAHSIRETRDESQFGHPDDHVSSCNLPIAHSESYFYPRSNARHRFALATCIPTPCAMVSLFRCKSDAG